MFADPDAVRRESHWTPLSQPWACLSDRSAPVKFVILPEQLLATALETAAGPGWRQVSDVPALDADVDVPANVRSAAAHEIADVFVLSADAGSERDIPRDAPADVPQTQLAVARHEVGKEVKPQRSPGESTHALETQ